MNILVEGKPNARCPSVTCYLCGREFGTTSISIHEKKCSEKWDLQQRHLPKHLRRPKPEKPTVIGGLQKAGVGQQQDGSGGGSIINSAAAMEEYNEAARDAFLNQAREECPNCSRRFAPSRLEVHLRSCRPGGFFERQRKAKVQQVDGEESEELEDDNTVALRRPSTTSQIQRSVVGQTREKQAVRAITSGSKDRNSPQRLPEIARQPQPPLLPRKQTKSANFNTGSRQRFGTTSSKSGSLEVVGGSVSRLSTPSAQSPNPAASSAPSKFCVECGYKHELAHAKFCAECGCKR